MEYRRQSVLNYSGTFFNISSQSESGLKGIEDIILTLVYLIASFGNQALKTSILILKYVVLVWSWRTWSMYRADGISLGPPTLKTTGASF